MKTRQKLWQLTVFFMMVLLAAIHAVAEDEGNFKIMDGVKYPYNKRYVWGALQSIAIGGSSTIASNSTATYTCTATIRVEGEVNYTYWFGGGGHTQRQVP